MDRYAKYYPRFSEGEYARRYDEIRRMMVERNISSLIIHGDSMKSNRMQANVRYITNFVDEVVSYVFFPLEGELTQWMDLKHHLTNARAVSVIKDIRSRRSALSHVGDQASELVERIKQARLENTRLGIVGYQLMHELPYDIMEALKRGLPNATFENVTEVYDEIQMYHSTEEVEFMKKAARFTDVAAEGMIKAIKPGATEAEIYGHTHAASLIRGGEFDFSLIASTPMSDPSMPYPFPIPSHRRIRIGDIVSTEISAGYWGYSGQLCRSIAVRKKPTNEWQGLFDLALEVYKDIQKVLKPGNTTHDVAKIGEKITQSGYIAESFLIHGLSPGAGFGSNYSVRVLEEKGVDLPKVKFIENVPIMTEPNPCTRDLRMGVFLGNANRVTEFGGKSYQKFPLEFTVTR